MAIQDILDPGEEPEEFKKSKFWHKLFLNYKKIGLVIGALFLIGFIVKVMFMCFVTYQGYQDNKASFDSLKVQYARSEKIINARIDSMSTSRKSISSQHFLMINGVVASLLKDFSSKDVNYKKDQNGVVYYFSNGLLYQAIFDTNSGNYFYVNELHQSIWCR